MYFSHKQNILPHSHIPIQLPHQFSPSLCSTTTCNSYLYLLLSIDFFAFSYTHSSRVFTPLLLWNCFYQKAGNELHVAQANGHFLNLMLLKKVDDKPNILSCLASNTLHWLVFLSHHWLLFLGFFCRFFFISLRSKCWNLPSLRLWIKTKILSTPVLFVILSKLMALILCMADSQMGVST